MRSIAIIDDDFRVLESLQNLLTSFGYQSETYLSADDFLQSDGPSHSDCIVTDVHMPKMNGLETPSAPPKQRVRGPRYCCYRKTISKPGRLLPRQRRERILQEAHRWASTCHIH